MPRLAHLIHLALLCSVVGCDDNGCRVHRCNRDRSIDPSTIKAPAFGSETALVDVTVFGDLQCPHTKRILVELDHFSDHLEDDGREDGVQVIFRHLFRADSSGSRDAAIATAAAHRQGDEAVWGRSDKVGFLWCLLFLETIDHARIMSCAETAVLDLDRFSSDFWSDETASAVEQDLEAAKEIGLDGTPSIFLCEDQISGNPIKIIDCIEEVLEVEEKLVEDQETHIFS